MRSVGQQLSCIPGIMVRDHENVSPPQVSDVQEMLFGWRGTFVATLNATWDMEDTTDTDLASFVKSFEHVYCFGPLDIQVHHVVACEQGLRVGIKSATSVQSRHTEKL
jgi:hypothetical protein